MKSPAIKASPVLTFIVMSQYGVLFWQGEGIFYIINFIFYKNTYYTPHEAAQVLNELTDNISPPVETDVAVT